MHRGYEGKTPRKTCKQSQIQHQMEVCTQETHRLCSCTAPILAQQPQAIGTFVPAKSCAFNYLAKDLKWDSLKNYLTTFLEIKLLSRTGMFLNMKKLFQGSRNNMCLEYKHIKLQLHYSTLAGTNSNSTNTIISIPII